MKRLIWADLLKLVTIYLVVVGHVVLFYMGGDKDDELYNIVYSFHMPLFMTISGFFSSKIAEGKFDIKKKFKQLIIPCITLAVIFLLFGIKTQNMWYLKSLFICYCITILLYKLKTKFNVNNICSFIYFIVLFLIFAPVLCSLPYIHSYKVDFMLPFFIWGCYFRKSVVLLRPKYIIIYLAISLLLLIGWNSDYLWYNSNPLWIDIKESIKQGTICCVPSSLFTNLYRFCTGFFVSILLISIFSNFCNNPKIAKFADLGRYSLHVYIIQTFLVEINVFRISISAQNIYAYNVIYTLVISAIVTAACIILAMLLEKINIVNRLLFGKL